MAGVNMKGSRSAPELQLYGDVGWDITPPAVAAAMPKDQSLPLTVNLFSPGGDALAGLGVFDILDRYEASSPCASTAWLPAQAV
jgi:ATP-dependent protease ClpP protease subunit